MKEKGYNFLRSKYHKLKACIKKIIIAFFSICKINNNKIVVGNFFGRGYGDNPKYIVDALLKLDSNLDIVWLVSDMRETFPKGVRKVKFGSLKMFKELSTAKIWINNIKNSFTLTKRKEQFYLQTWHGGIALKGIEGQVEDKLNPNYVEESKKDSKQIDLMLSDSDWTTNLYSKYFWYDGPILKTGFPRNDILVNRNKNIIQKVYNFFNINKNKKILLYAPTFRDDELNLNVYKFNFNKIINYLNTKFNSDFVLLIRMHPNISQSLLKQKNYNVGIPFINAGDYPDMQELLLATEVLITDYSSSMFDAMLANKKVFLLAKDLDKYSNRDRKLLFNIKDELPFSFSSNEEEIIQEIDMFEPKKYLDNVKKFSSNLGLFEDGEASKRVASLLLTKMGENKE